MKTKPFTVRSRHIKLALSLAALLSCASCHRDDDRIKLTRSRLAKLASVNTAPELIARPREVRRLLNYGLHRVALFPVDFDWENQDEIVNAIQELGHVQSEGELDEILKHENDTRYCVTYYIPDEVDPRNYTVGAICHDIAVECVAGEAFETLGTDDRGLQVDVWNIRQALLDMRKWRSSRANAMIAQLQIEVCKLILDELPRIDRLSDDDRKEKRVAIEQLMQEIVDSKKPARCQFWKDSDVAYTEEKAQTVRQLLNTRLAIPEAAGVSIDDLANRNPPPILETKKKPRRNKNHDWAEDGRVLGVWRLLLEQSDVKFDELLNNQEDPRYAITYLRRRVAVNATVGSTCRSIVRKRMIDFFADNYVLLQTPATRWDDFEFKSDEWFSTHRQKSLADLQREYLNLVKVQVKKPEARIEDEEVVAAILKNAEDMLGRIDATGAAIPYTGTAYASNSDEVDYIRFMCAENSDVDENVE